MGKWEYKSVTIVFSRKDYGADTEAFLTRKLNELGRDGWEVMDIRASDTQTIYNPHPVVDHFETKWYVRFRRYVQ